MKIKNRNRNRVTHKNRKHTLKRRRTLKGGSDTNDNKKKINFDVLLRNTPDQYFNFDQMCGSDFFEQGSQNNKSAFSQGYFSNNQAGKSLCERILTGSMGKVTVYRMLYDENTVIFDQIRNSKGMDEKDFIEIFNSRCDDQTLNPAHIPIKKEIVQAMLSKLLSRENNSKFVELTEKRTKLLELINKGGDQTVIDEALAELLNINSEINDLKSIIDNIKTNLGLLREFLENYFGINGNTEKCKKVKKIVRLIMVIYSIIKYGQFERLENDDPLKNLLTTILTHYGTLIDDYVESSPQVPQSSPTDVTEEAYGFNGVNEPENYGFPPINNQGGGKRRYKKLTKKRRTQKGGDPDPYANRQLISDKDLFAEPFSETWQKSKQRSIWNPLRILGLVTFIGDTFSNVKTYATQFWKNKRTDIKTFNQMENILSRIPRNIRALTYIIFYTLHIFIKSKSPTPAPQIIFKNYIENVSNCYGGQAYNVSLLHLINSFKLEKNMPQKIIDLRYSSHRQNYDYALFLLSLKEALINHSTYTLSNVVKDILEFCVVRIFILCNIFHQILENHQKDQPLENLNFNGIAGKLEGNDQPMIEDTSININDIKENYLRYIDLYNNTSVYNSVPIKKKFINLVTNTSYDSTSVNNNLEEIFKLLSFQDPISKYLITSSSSVSV